MKLGSYTCKKTHTLWCIAVVVWALVWDRGGSRAAWNLFIANKAKKEHIGHLVRIEKMDTLPEEQSSKK